MILFHKWNGEMIKVILLIDCSSEFDRKLLRGIMRYSRDNGPWLFYRVPSNLKWKQNREDWVVEWAGKWQADAVIGRCDEDKVGLLSSLNIPIVLQNNRSRSDVYSNLTGDYKGTGRMAAEYFRRKLYTSYAFFGVRKVIWSEERKEGFVDAVSSYNSTCAVFDVNPDVNASREDVIEWLKSLPKPTALFCCDDAHALFITETCGICGIRIPEDISVLGVDNDDLLCSISDPPISSIELDVENGGYMTCQFLHQRIVSGSNMPFDVVIRPLGINERQSSSFHHISDTMIMDMVRYIDENYFRDISVNDIFSLVPLSRRSLEMKFKKIMGTTVYQYLISVRIEHLAYLLTTTDRPLADLAFEVGFNDSNNISRIFKNCKGCTPVEYRRKNCVI